MLNFRSKGLIFFVFLLVSVFFARHFHGIYEENQKDQIEKALFNSNLNKETKKLINKINQIWRSPKITEYFAAPEFQCSEFKKDHQKIPKFYFECNPDFFRCALNYEISKKSLSGEIFQRNYFQIRSDELGWRLELPLKDMFVLRIEDSCRDVLIPKEKYLDRPRNYSSQIDFEIKKEVWEVKNDLFLDKYLVTNRDIREWAKFQKIPVKVKSGEWYLPALNLKQKQMQDYCAYRGKKVAESRVLDAASFLPKSFYGDHQNEFRGKFPQSHSKDIKKNFKNDSCFGAFTKECLVDNEKKYFAHSQITWVGIYQVQGGPFEFVKNKAHPKFNLRSSSYYFPLENPYSSLGARIHWDAQGYELKNLKYYDTDNDDEALRYQGEFEIGFRCQK